MLASRLGVCLLLTATLASGASDPVAATLAREAHDARVSGQVVRAYLLYAEAAARDPRNSTYRANRDALAPAAKLLTKAEIQTADVSTDVKAAERARTQEPPVEFAKEIDWERDPDLQPLPHLQPKPSLATFDTRGDEKTLFEQVVAAYGIRPIFDPQLDVQTNIRFSITQADFRTAMEALTAVTHTFLFPISQHEIFIARDTETKRDEYEPSALLVVPLPNALTTQDVIEAATAVRAVLSTRIMGWDTYSRHVMVRDRYSRAQIARALMESLLLPQAQVSLEVQFLTFDSDRNLHYGASLQNAFQVVDFGHVGALKNVLPSLNSNVSAFLGIGSGAALFGIGVTSAALFANYSESASRNLFDATTVVMSGQSVSFHVGDKYPIPQTLYTGFQQSSASIYNPVGQITMEDLGILLKITPRVHAEGNIALEVEGDLKSLGTETLNTIPTISEREFKGSVEVREGQWAVIAGLETITRSRTRSGLAGVAQIPGLDQVLGENTSGKTLSSTLLLIKPTVTRLPMSPLISPQFFVGPFRGERVVM